MVDSRVLDQGDAATHSKQDIPQIELERVFELGFVLAARTLWEDLGIDTAIRPSIPDGELTAPHETALFAMAANRLDQPGSKLACAMRWLPDIALRPDGKRLNVDQLYGVPDALYSSPSRALHGLDVVAS